MRAILMWRPQCTPMESEHQPPSAAPYPLIVSQLTAYFIQQGWGWESICHGLRDGWVLYGLSQSHLSHHSE